MAQKKFFVDCDKAVYILLRYYLKKILEPHIVELMKDANGNHIIIKYVNTIKFPKNQFLYNGLLKLGATA